MYYYNGYKFTFAFCKYWTNTDNFGIVEWLLFQRIEMDVLLNTNSLVTSWHDLSIEHYCTQRLYVRYHDSTLSKCHWYKKVWQKHVFQLRSFILPKKPGYLRFKIELRIIIIIIIINDLFQFGLWQIVHKIQSIKWLINAKKKKKKKI